VLARVLEREPRTHPITTAIPTAFPSIVSTSPVWSPARMSIPSEPTDRAIAWAQRTARPGPSNVAKNEPVGGCAR